MLNQHYPKIGMIARWKPLHLGHVAVLQALCQRGDFVLIGMGSSNRYNVRNRWRVLVRDLFGELDLFVTDNPYVTSLLEKDYRIIRPVELLPSEEQVRINGNMVRAMMARGEKWQAWVPESCADYIQKNKLDERFRKEFGLETLALVTVIES
jgi:nicotinamide-nucleotide adenylyltransferase